MQKLKYVFFVEDEMKQDLRKLIEEYQSLPEYVDRILSDVNQLSNFGDRPIHIAAVRGNLRELDLLYENGADVNAEGEYGYTPLLYAAEQGHLEAVKWLVEHGANILARNIDGYTAYDIACTLKHDGIMNFLSKKINRY